MSRQQKTVLVQLEKFNRKICFEVVDGENEIKALEESVRNEFKDTISLHDKLTFQANDEDFDGVFVDFFETTVPDKCVFKLVIEKAKVLNFY